MSRRDRPRGRGRWSASAGLALALAALALVALAVAANADPSSPSTQELIQRLQPQPHFRGLEVGKPKSADSAESKQPSVDLAVNFAFGSAQLTTDGELLLDNLGRALKDPALNSSRFSIDGHTDAVGGAEFNQRLSEERAEAVRQYLISRYGVDAGRLEAHGYGFSRLLDKNDPTSGVNRRVEITNLGPAS